MKAAMRLSNAQQTKVMMSMGQFHSMSGVMFSELELADCVNMVMNSVDVLSNFSKP